MALNLLKQEILMPSSLWMLLLGLALEGKTMSNPQNYLRNNITVFFALAL